MPASSPYTGNDYQSISNFRPYVLPVNDIFKAIQAQNMYWDQGASRVKSVYDNALDLRLSLEPNKQLRKQFMDSSEKQLDKLSSMDLSDPSVQRQGFNIFKPLFQDEGIVYDDLMTRHYDKVRNDALGFRQSNNGKEYSDINLSYAMDGYNEFVSSKDRMAGKKFYQNRREYTPYYDYTEDFAKALKGCNPSSVETGSPIYGDKGTMTGYTKDQYVKSLSVEQARGCIEAGLSPNAARQLQIEGAVSYKNHPDVLASDTASYLSTVSGNLSSQLQSLAGKKAALSSSKDYTEDQKKLMSSQYDEAIRNISDEIDKTNHSVNKLNNGDYSDLKENFDSYAGSVYSWKKLYRKALASSFQEQKEIYKADPVQLNAIKFSQDKYLNQMDYGNQMTIEQMKENHDSEMKHLELMYGKGNTANGIIRDPLTGMLSPNSNLLRESSNIPNSQKPSADDQVYEKLTNNVNALNESEKSNNLQLYNTLIERGNRDKDFRDSLLKGFNQGTSSADWENFKAQNKNNSFYISSLGRPGGLHETSWFKAYLEQNPNDEDANSWATDHMEIQAAVNTLNRKLEIGENQVKQELGGDYGTKVRDQIKNIKPIKVGNTTITPNDIQDAIEGKSTKGIQVKDEHFYNTYSEGPYDTNYKQVYINGQFDKNLREMYSKVASAGGDVSQALHKKRVEVYNQLGFDKEPWFFTPDSKSPIVETIKSIAPTDSKGNPLDVSIISSDFSGGVKVKIPGLGNTEGVDLIRKQGIGKDVEALGDGIFKITGTNYNVIPQAMNNPILKDAAYQLATIGETQAFRQTQPGARVTGSDISVPVLVSGKMRTMTIQVFKNGETPEYRIYMEGATTSKPLVTANNAYDLFAKLANTPIDLNKPAR